MKKIKSFFRIMYGQCWQCGGHGSTGMNEGPCPSCFGSGHAGFIQYFLATAMIGIVLFAIFGLISVAIDPVSRDLFLHNMEMMFGP